MIPWLKLVWFAGESYEPIGRWAIYEMYPELEHTPDEILADLKGPSPRDPGNGRWKEDDTVPQHLGGKRWVSDSTVSLQQWNLFREFNCYPRLFWIVQGKYGGHKWVLSPEEQSFLKLRGHKLTDTPAPGDLPYAKFDQRVMVQLREYDRLYKYDKTLSWEKRAKDKNRAIVLLQEQRDEDLQKFRHQLDRWLTAQVMEVVDETYPFWRDADLPAGDRYFDHDRDAVERLFIEGK